MTLTHVHLYYPSDIDSTGSLSAQVRTWYDLRTVAAAIGGTAIGSLATVVVRLRGFPPETQLLWPRTEFEAAKALSLAATGG